MNKQSIKRRNPIYINIGMAITLCLLGAFLSRQVFSGKIHSKAAFDEVALKLTQSLDPEAYPQVETSAFRRYIDLDPAEFNEIRMYRNEDLMSAGEMVIAHFDNSQAAKAFETAIQNRITSQHDIYSSYAPEQTAMMENALVDIQDNYGFYYVGDNPAGVDGVFLSALKGGQ